MVILQFNKLIRNKWLWGAFAIAISAFFAFDFLLADLRSDSREGNGGGVGRLAGADVTVGEFETFAQDARGIGNNRDTSSSTIEINRKAWKSLAAAKTAEKNGLVVTDAQLAQEIERMFGAQGGLDFNQYRMMLAGQLGVTPEQFEAYVRRQMLVRDGVRQSLLGSAVWASPMELDQAVNDRTDVYTVRVARFSQDKAEADAVKMTPEGLKKWFDENVDKLALPERIKVRVVKFDATATNVLAKMSVSEDDMLAFYDAIDDSNPKYTTVDTNGVKTIRQYADVKADIEKELRQIEAVGYFQTNILSRAYATLTEADKGKSRVDTIAAEEGLTVTESNWFSLDGKYVEGFMVRAESVTPGANNFIEEVSQIDPDTEDFRYAIVSSDRAVWLVERSALSEAHTPTFEEAKEKIVVQALRDARAEAFKAKVDAVIKQGKDAVLASKDVSTNITFSVAELQRGAFPDQYAVVGSAMKLKKGELSEFTKTGLGSAVVVYCVDRVPGDVSKAVFMRSGIRDQVSMPAFAQVADKWDEWNLARLGCETTDRSAMVEEKDDAED